MNGKAKVIRTLGIVLLSAAVLLSSQAPALAKSKKSRKRSAEAVAKARRKAADAQRKAANAQRKAAEERAKAWRRVGRGRTAHRGVTVVRSGYRSVWDGGRIISFGTSKGRTRVTISLGGGSRQKARRWIPGRYETRIQQVCVQAGRYERRIERVCVEPGRYETRYVSAVEEVLYDSSGNPHRVVVHAGRAEKVWVPPRYELREVKVWVPPRYELRQVRVLVPGHWVTETVSTPRRSGLNLSALLRF